MNIWQRQMQVCQVGMRNSIQFLRVFSIYIRHEELANSHDKENFFFVVDKQ